MKKYLLLFLLPVLLSGSVAAQTSAGLFCMPTLNQVGEQSLYNTPSFWSQRAEFRVEHQVNSRWSLAVGAGMEEYEYRSKLMWEQVCFGFCGTTTLEPLIFHSGTRYILTGLTRFNFYRSRRFTISSNLGTDVVYSKSKEAKNGKLGKPGSPSLLNLKAGIGIQYHLGNLNFQLESYYSQNLFPFGVAYSLEQPVHRFTPSIGLTYSFRNL